MRIIALALAIAAGPPDREPLPPGAVARFGSEYYRDAMNARLDGPVSLDGRRVALGIGGEVSVRDAVTGASLYRIRAEHPLSSGPLSADGRRLFVARPGTPSPLALWPRSLYLAVYDIDTGRNLFYQGRDEEGLAGAISPDGKRLAVWQVNTIPEGTGDEKRPGPSPFDAVEVWDVDTGKRLRTIRTPDVVCGAAFSPDGKELAVATEARVLRYDEGRLVRRHDVPNVRSLAYSPDARLLLLGSHQGDVTALETATGRALALASVDRHGDVYFTFRGGRPIAWGWQPSLCRVGRDLFTGRAVTPEACLTHAVSSLRWTGADRLTAASVTGEFAEWSLTGERLRGRGDDRSVGAPFPFAGKMHPLMSPCGRYMAHGPSVSGCSATSARERRASSRRRRTAATAAACSSPHGSPFRRTARIGSRPPRARRTGRTTSATARPVPGMVFDDGHSTAQSPDGTEAVTATVRLEEGRVLFRVTGQGGTEETEYGSSNFDYGRPDVLAYAPNGRFIVAAPAYQSRLWALQPGSGARRHEVELPHRREGDASRPYTMFTAAPQVGRGGHCFVEPQRDRNHKATRLRVVETRTGRVRLTLDAPTEVSALALSPCGRMLASGQENGVVYVWSLLAEGGAGDVWAKLGGDVEGAWRAASHLVRRPKEGVALLRKHLRPIKGEAPGEAEVTRLVEKLGADDFADRKAASDALSRRLIEVEDRLRLALVKAADLEVKQRLRRLLSASPPLWPKQLLAEFRAVEALSLMGTPEARRLLREIAAGYKGSRLTQEAAWALKDLAER